MLQGSKKKADPKAKRPVEAVFKLKQTGEPLAGPGIGPDSPTSEAKAAKPPKAVYVKKTRDELYNHKLELKPFNWYDQKQAKATFKEHLENNK